MLKRLFYFYDKYPVGYFLAVSFAVFYFLYDGNPTNVSFYFLYLPFFLMACLIFYLHKWMMVSYFLDRGEKIMRFYRRTLGFYSSYFLLLVLLKPFFFGSFFLRTVVLLSFFSFICFSIGKRLYSKDIMSMNRYILMESFFLFLTCLLVPSIPLFVVVIMLMGR